MKKLLLLIPVLTFLFISTGSVQAQDSPILEVPPDLDRVVIPTVTFGWQDLTGVLSYTIDIANDPIFATMIGPGITCNTNSCTPGALNSNTTYFWRVRGNYSSGPGPSSLTFRFTTAGTPSQEVDYLRNIVNNLETANQLPVNQGNILNNRLTQVQNQLALGHELIAELNLLLFDARTVILQYSGLLSTSNAQSLRDYAGKIFDLINNSSGKNVTQNYHQYVTPNEFSLGQNYPNPFNPTTNIEYSVTATSNVSLKVYDMLGKEVATLVNKQQDAGTYIVNWNASGLASGIYFYRLSAGSFVSTKKLTLTK